MWEEYPLVKDKRNFHESKGGKGIPPQGRILYSLTRHTIINKELLPEETISSWNYVVTVNCMRTLDVPSILEKLSTQLLPESEKNRLGIILGINERVTIENKVDYAPTFEEILPQQEKLRKLGVPILVVYSQWTSWREKTMNKDLSAQKIREELQARLEKLSERQRIGARKRLLEQDNSHQFPFGRMRAHVLNYGPSQQFLEAIQMQGKNSKPVYVHIQDADFINLQTRPLFYGFQSEAIPPLKNSGQQYLLKRYDTLIYHKHTSSGLMPLMVGGGHVYSPDEKFEGADKDCKDKNKGYKYWTRFASEMGNMIKDDIGLYQPYGIYFHEPNTLILSPYSLGLVNQENKDWKTITSRFKKFTFGIDSEIPEFSRKILQNIPDDTCRKLMIFSSDTILETSMKRGGRQRNFAIEFCGKYDIASSHFLDWSLSDIGSIHGMPQEVIHPNKWASMICTGWSSHRKIDSRAQMAELFNMFDPYNISGKKTLSSFWRTLIKFDEIIDKKSIADTFSFLSGAYDKQGQGKLIAFYMLSQAWETGQVMRIMFLDHLSKPANSQLQIPSLRGIREFLASRRNTSSQDLYPVVPSSFIVIILGLDQIPKPFTREHIVAEVVCFAYENNGKNKAQTARDFRVAATTITKLMNEKSPRKSKEIYNALSEKTVLEISEKYNITPEDVEKLKRRLF
eukprot:gene5142-8782_t